MLFAPQLPSQLSEMDELDSYLRSEPDFRAKDGLSWWHEHRTHYPHLARMALDYLSIPGTFEFPADEYILYLF